MAVLYNLPKKASDYPVKTVSKNQYYQKFICSVTPVEKNLYETIVVKVVTYKDEFELVFASIENMKETKQITSLFKDIFNKSRDNELESTVLKAVTELKGYNMLGA